MNAGITGADIGRAEAVGSDAIRGRFEVGARATVELRLLVVNLPPEDAIGVGDRGVHGSGTRTKRGFGLGIQNSGQKNGDSYLNRKLSGTQ